MESIQKTIIERGTAISSQEALADITPIDWSKDVLDGKYRDKAIVKYDEKEVVEICKKYDIETVEKEGYPLYQDKDMDENFSIADIMRESILITEE